jgi:hypothetical protein
MDGVAAALNLRENLVQCPDPPGQSQRYARDKAKMNEPSDISKVKWPKSRIVWNIEEYGVGLDVSNLPPHRYSF